MPYIQARLRLRRIALLTPVKIILCGWMTLLDTCQSAHSDPTKPGKDAKKNQSITVTYDVGDLVSVHSLRRRPFVLGHKVEEGIDGLAQMILGVIDCGNWSANSSSNSLQELNGKLLEIRTSADNHAQIGELLRALRRLADLAVIIESDLYEVDRGFYQKNIEPFLKTDKGATEKRFAAVIDEMLVKKLREQGRRLSSNKVTIPDRESRNSFSWRTAFNYKARPKPKNSESSDYLQTAFHGVSLETGVNVTADRHLVNLTLAQRTTELIDIGKELVADPETGDDVNVDVPNLLTLSTSTTIQAEDGQAIVVPVHYRPPSLKGKDRLLLMLVRATIYIEEEERQRKEGKR